MALEDAIQASAELEHVIERQIVQRTWGRIHRLQVKLVDDRVVVRGQTSSYYAKQLALEGVLDVIGSSGLATVDLDIQVGIRPATALSAR